MYRAQDEDIGQNHFGQQIVVRRQFCERPYSQEFRKFGLKVLNVLEPGQSPSTTGTTTGGKAFKQCSLITLNPKRRIPILVTQ